MFPGSGTNSSVRSPHNYVSQKLQDQGDYLEKGYFKEKTEISADAPKEKGFEVKMVGGRYPWEGHLKIRESGGQWGAICSDEWTLKEAIVACRETGGELYGLAKTALKVAYFGGEDLPKKVFKVNCQGRESQLSHCDVIYTSTEHKCSKQTNVAGVVCTNQLPDLRLNLLSLRTSIRLQDQPLHYLECSMEENCLAKSAYEVKATKANWRNMYRRLMRFSTVVKNVGTADFKPFKNRNQWEWHACHMHYHSMEVFAHYDLMDSAGNRLAEGSKASFCLEDTVCDKGTKPKYNCKGFSDQGLSVNCSDNYLYNIDCQWIDVTDIPPGNYTFLVEINPDFLVAESDFSNNVVSCQLTFGGNTARVHNCHYESLLDFRKPIK